MAELHLQRALARLLLDSEVVAALAAGDTEDLRSDYALTTAEVERLRGLVRGSRERLEFFTGLLATKRAARVAAALPLARAALGERRWEDAWLAYRSARPIEGAFTPSSDARAFAAFVREEALPALRAPAIVSEIFAYEEIKLEVASAPQTGTAVHAGRSAPPPEVGVLCPLLRQPSRLAHFHHHVADAILALKNGRLSDVTESPTWILVYRGRRGAVAAAKVGAGLVPILKRCDGKQTAATIIRTVGCERPDEALEHVSDLARRGVIELLSAPLSAGER